MRKLLASVALVGILAAPGMVEAQATVGAAAAYYTEGDGAVAIVVRPLEELGEERSRAVEVQQIGVEL